MTSYVVCHVRTLVMGEAVVEYLRAIDETLGPHGGRFIIHGGPVDVREGPWSGDLVVLEFPSHRSATDWYESAAYRRIAPLRTRNSESTVFIIDGVDPTHRAPDILSH